MDKNALFANLEDILELDENTLTEETILADIEEWDSLAKLSLMAMARKEFDVSLTAQQIKNFIAVKDICDALI